MIEGGQTAASHEVLVLLTSELIICIYHKQFDRSRHFSRTTTMKVPSTYETHVIFMSFNLAVKMLTQVVATPLPGREPGIWN